MKPLGNFLLPRKSKIDKASVAFSELQPVSFGTFNGCENKALPATLKAEPRLEIKPGDWLISRANITRLVGACALVAKEVPSRLMLCDKIFRAVWRHDQEAIALPAYLDAVLKTPHLRQQIEVALTGSSPTMKNISKPSLLALRLPCPPVHVQKRLVETLNTAQESASKHRIEAQLLRQRAKQEIEAALLGESPQNPISMATHSNPQPGTPLETRMDTGSTRHAPSRDRAPAEAV